MQEKSLERFLLIFLAQALPDGMGEKISFIWQGAYRVGKSEGAKFNLQAVIHQSCGRGGSLVTGSALCGRGRGAFPHSAPPLLSQSRRQPRGFVTLKYGNTSVLSA